MLDKEDLQAISQLMDVKLASFAQQIDARFDAQDKRFDRIEARLDNLEKQQASTLELATRTALTQENIVLPAINALVEGQEMTHQMIKQLATKEEVQDVRDQLQVIKTVVASHSRDIEQLKKAQ